MPFELDPGLILPAVLVLLPAASFLVLFALLLARGRSGKWPPPGDLRERRGQRFLALALACGLGLTLLSFLGASSPVASALYAPLLTAEAVFLALSLREFWG